MKTIKLLAVAALAMLAADSSAQLTKDFTGWRRFEVSFNAMSWKDENAELYAKNEGPWSDGWSPFVDAKGFSLGLIKGASVSKKVPLFLEFGGRLSWIHSSDDKYFDYLDYYDDEGSHGFKDKKTTFMNLAIPVNVAYKFTFGDAGKVAIVPFFGLNYKFTFLARMKYNHANEDYDCVPGKNCDYEIGEYKLNLFKEEDDDDDEGFLLENEDTKVFQFGLNVGVGFHLKKFYVGYTFQPDLTPFFKYEGKSFDYKEKMRNSLITVGINF